MLLAGAGLLTRTLLQLSEVKTGLKDDGVLTMEVPIGFGTRSADDARAFYDRMRLEVGAIPGVKEVGLGSTMPLRTAGFQLDVKAEGRTQQGGEAQPRAEFRTANPEYFSAAGIPLLKGREFASTDRVGSGQVVILNKTAADKLFQEADKDKSGKLDEKQLAVAIGLLTPAPVCGPPGGFGPGFPGVPALPPAPGGAAPGFPGAPPGGFGRPGGGSGTGQPGLPPGAPTGPGGAGAPATPPAPPAPPGSPPVEF